MNLIVMTGLCFLAHLPWWKGWQSLLSVKKRFVIWLPWWLSDKVSTGQCRRCRRCRFNPWVGKIPRSRKQQPAPAFLPGKSHGQRSLAGYSPWGCKELDMTEHTHTDVCDQDCGYCSLYYCVIFLLFFSDYASLCCYTITLLS